MFQCNFHPKKLLIISVYSAKIFFHFCHLKNKKNTDENEWDVKRTSAYTQTLTVDGNGKPNAHKISILTNKPKNFIVC